MGISRFPVLGGPSSCRDWRMTSKGASARGEETDFRHEELSKATHVESGSDRLAQQRPEESPPVAPSHGERSGAPLAPTPIG